MLMRRSSRSTGRFRLAVALTVVLLVTAGWLCLVDSHEGHDHVLLHDLCAGMIVVAGTMLTAVILARAGALKPNLGVLLSARAVPVLDPPPRSARSR
jgi:hypothetical protein